MARVSGKIVWDIGAKLEVTKLLEGVGWGVVDLGDITKSRLLEPLALIWITHGFNSAGLTQTREGTS